MTNMHKSSCPTAFGRLLRFWRNTFEHSQEQLALALESSPRHISRLENGRVSPSRDIILRIADTFELGERDRTQLLFAAGFSMEQPAATLEDPHFDWLRKVVAIKLRMVEPCPAILIGFGNRIYMVNRAFLGIVGERLQPDTKLDALFYFDWLFGMQRQHMATEAAERRLSGILMTLQQEALLWDDPAAAMLVDTLAERHAIPADWRRRAAAVEPQTSFPARLETPWGVHTFLHESHLVNPVGPSTTLSQPRLVMVTLFPADPELDLSPLLDHKLVHPLLYPGAQASAT